VVIGVKTRRKRRATYRCKSRNALHAALLHVPVEGGLAGQASPWQPLSALPPIGGSLRPAAVPTMLAER
jgi:hypothetical protein